jgi:uncharacterized membrane protein
MGMPSPRSDKLLHRLLIIVATIGLLAAGYLSYVKLFGGVIACGTGGCEVVANSRWAELAGIPVVLLGVLAYSSLLLSACFPRSDQARTMGAIIAIIGAFFSAFLQYQALVVLQHLCPYCLVSACCMWSLAVITGLRVWRGVPLAQEGAGSSSTKVSATSTSSEA